MKMCSTMEKGPRYSYTQAVDLEFLLRRTQWRVAAQNILFRSGDIVENAQRGEDVEDKTK